MFMGCASIRSQSVSGSTNKVYGDSQASCHADVAEWGDGLGLVTIIVALGNDLAVFELEEGCEMGAHLAACRNGLKRDGEGAGPIDFKGDLITTG